ncbi:hypothetical protein DFH08DRAFT_1019820 [Mycena albidolilacea]|uniref:Uncharacterized protein n=1 Tax=Mycena albidolilacea TaxID=1033008 RepID=A0AAD7EK35_9AGAR|nr:hypothetical protein DFH08DRAFT_1019820 [Mycena albidolilacea]
MSWGDIHVNTTVTPSTNTVPIPIGAALTSTSSSQSQSSASSSVSRTPSRLPLKPSIKPYTPMPTYFPKPLPAVPESPEAGTPSMLSSIPCVNINTRPRVPISPQMRAGSLPVQLASPHLHPTNLNGTVSPASVCVELHLHAHSPHVCPTQLGSPQFHPQPPPQRCLAPAHSPNASGSSPILGPTQPCSSPMPGYMDRKAHFGMGLASASATT